jgi:hypothetical protein
MSVSGLQADTAPQIFDARFTADVGLDLDRRTNPASASRMVNEALCRLPESGR